jgi:hypothetical protein
MFIVYMARYVMVLRRATSLRGALEGLGPENRDFLGLKKSINDVARLKTVKYKRHINSSSYYFPGVKFLFVVLFRSRRR